MKLVVIKGTYHNNGIISTLSEVFIEGFKSKCLDAEIQVFDLMQYEIDFCEGCRACCVNDGQELGTCIKKDETKTILQEMLHCDRLLLASPVYAAGITARMQRFVERCIPSVVWEKEAPEPRNPTRKVKRGMILVSSATPSPFNRILGTTRHPIKVLSNMCKLYGCGKIDKLTPGGLEANDEARRKYLIKVHRAGATFAKP